MYNSVVSFFQDGGAFMYPIAIVFAIGLAASIERFIYLNVTRAKNRIFWNRLTPVLTKGDIRQALQACTSSDTALGRIIAYGLSILDKEHQIEDVERAMEEGMLEIVPRLEKRTPYIATLANIATLLGLLGTIMGLITAFTAVANADPAEKANLLSASISVAMNTTAFGLMVAIPLLLLFTYLQSKTNEIVDSLEMASVKVINIVRKAQIHSAARAAAAQKSATPRRTP
ncbi:MAG: MotA/TolQ/ExbB proton channel family protein [Pseudomonadota bacterium]